jgi:selenocysteine lyase/cysteine desulfurase
MLESMGFEKGAGLTAEAFEPLCARYRDEFPVTRELIYLNHAAVAPPCRRSAEAMKALADDACSYGSLHYDKWMQAYAGLRSAAAKLIHASADEIAIVKNTSEGIATVALGLEAGGSSDRVPRRIPGKLPSVAPP